MNYLIGLAHGKHAVRKSYSVEFTNSATSLKCKTCGAITVQGLNIKSHSVAVESKLEEGPREEQLPSQW